MNCKWVQQHIPLWHLGELSPTVSRKMERHLETCEECLRANEQHRSLEALLADYRPPEFPQHFGFRLHERLVEESRKRTNAVLSPATPVSSRTRGFIGLAAALVVGVLVGAVATYGLLAGPWSPHHSHGSMESASTGPGNGPRTQIATVSGAISQGQRAVIALEIDIDRNDPQTRLDVTLPDGLVWIGENQTVSRERRLTIVEPMRAGKHRIELGVMAVHPGNWTILATAHSLGTKSTVRTKVTVLPSHGRST